MTESQFKVGDIVELSSGGPPMTVKTIFGEKKTKATCSWFNDKKELKTEAFELAQLKPASPTKFAP